jgi:hypothetical protein
LRQFARPFGKVATQSALRRKSSPTEIVCLATSFLLYWAGLQKEEDKGALEMGAGALKEAALAFHPQIQPRDDQGDGALMLQ